MNSVERVKNICKERKIALSRLEKDLGFGNGYIGQLKKGSFPDDRLAKIASYLSVTVDFLLTGEEKAPSTSGERTATGKFDFARDKHEEEMLVLARHMKDIPDKDRQELTEQFQKSVELYLRAKGISTLEGE